MVSISIETWGILCLSLQGLLVTCFLVMGRVLQEWQWPYFRMMSLTHFITAAGLFFGLLVAQTTLPERKVWKWVFFRGVFGTSAFILQILGVRLGAGPGDVAALTSVNTVAAALLGRAFLGENLRWLHAVSLCFTIGGAILIAQPVFLFGQKSSDESSGSGVGLVLATASGFCYAGGFICSRKATGASPWLLAAVVVAMVCIALCVLPFTPQVEDFSLTAPMQNFRLASLVLAGMLVLTLSGWMTLCAGAKWCPAAISATTNLTARMVSGYLAQTLIFDTAPTPLNLAGAASMGAGVAVIILPMMQCFHGASAPHEEGPVAGVTSTEATTSEDVSNVSSTSRGDEDETESLGSIIASEYVEFRSQEHSDVRFRPRLSEPAAQTIGAC